jgi:hemolysin activation/secretion protein
MGSRYTGRWRFGVGLDLNSPLTLADKLSIFGLTTDTSGLNSLSLSYSLPLGGHGLGLDLSYSQISYKLGEEFAVLDASGRAETFEASLNYPLIRSAARNFYIELGGTYKNMKDAYEALDYSETTRSLAGRLNLRYQTWTSLLGKPLFMNIGGGLVIGNLHVPDDQKAFARGTDGGFSYVTLDFLANLSLTDNLLFSFTASGQKTLRTNLDSSEQFNVTGNYGVKAYRESISGDNGYLLGGELLYQLPGLPERNLFHYLGVFADLGGWSYERAPFPEKRRDTLSDVGLSYTFGFGPVGLKARLARSLGDYPSELKPESRTYGSVLLTMSF